MYFRYNTQLGPPYHVIVDTNFIHFSIKNKVSLVGRTRDVLMAGADRSVSRREGLPVRRLQALRNGLRDGRAGDAGDQVQSRAQDSKGDLHGGRGTTGDERFPVAAASGHPAAALHASRDLRGRLHLRQSHPTQVLHRGHVRSRSAETHTEGKRPRPRPAVQRGAVFQIPGVPVMYIMARRYTIERLPEATLGGAPRF